MALVFLNSLLIAPIFAVAQSTLNSTILCVPGQCVQGYTNVTLGATLSSSVAPVPFHLLPGQYTSTTNPELLHSALTSSSSTLQPSAGLNSSTLSLPLDLSLQPGLATFSDPLYAGQTAFTSLPNTTNDNSSTPLDAQSLVLSSNVVVIANAASSSNRVVIWDSIHNTQNLPSPLNSAQFSLVDILSTTCSPACSSGGVCSPQGQCVCQPGFTGQSCEDCSSGFFGPSCQQCPDNCEQCDEGISGTGRCLKPSGGGNNCQCLNGVCNSDGSCTCNAGFTKADDGTQCAKCADGFFKTTTGDCKGLVKWGVISAQTVPAPVLRANLALLKTKVILQSVILRNKSLPLELNAQDSHSPTAAPVHHAPLRANLALAELPTTVPLAANGDGVCEGTNLIADNNKKESSRLSPHKLNVLDVFPEVFFPTVHAWIPAHLEHSFLHKTTCPVSRATRAVVLARTHPLSALLAPTQTSSLPTVHVYQRHPAPKIHSLIPQPRPAFPVTQTAPPVPGLPSINAPPAHPTDPYSVTVAACLRAPRTSIGIRARTHAKPAIVPVVVVPAQGRLAVFRARMAITSSSARGPVSLLLKLIPSETSNLPPVPTVTGIDKPTTIVKGKKLEWWQILLMALGCAFIFVAVIWCCRRRYRKKREEERRRVHAYAFANTSPTTAKKSLWVCGGKRDKKHPLQSYHPDLDHNEEIIHTGPPPKDKNSWKWRLIRFGEKFFGHSKSTRVYPVEMGPTTRSGKPIVVLSESSPHSRDASEAKVYHHQYHHSHSRSHSDATLLSNAFRDPDDHGPRDIERRGTPLPVRPPRSNEVHLLDVPIDVRTTETQYDDTPATRYAERHEDQDSPSRRGSPAPVSEPIQRHRLVMEDDRSEEEEDVLGLISSYGYPKTPPPTKANYFHHGSRSGTSTPSNGSKTHLLAASPPRPEYRDIHHHHHYYHNSDREHTSSGSSSGHSGHQEYRDRDDVDDDYYHDHPPPLLNRRRLNVPKDEDLDAYRRSRSSISTESMYSQMTGHTRRMPDARQPVRDANAVVPPVPELKSKFSMSTLGVEDHRLRGKLKKKLHGGGLFWK
ncbi:hypothetical protein D9756_009329 [Leucocoprinus leucothites]|uniref:EGF-like domain-containing protein n=1 Tax=Leucocoprinus leucothites TaxID=201217 RepID=A0A8H5FU48_9AGAR|nr:hypothetical protein D9756_009329 [Leucoagaricus leucothites]